MIYWSERLLSQNNLVFPKEWGKIKYIGSKTVHQATCAVDESGEDWCYTWSIHFENGTLPVAVGKTADAATIDQSLFDSDTNEYFNGGCYKAGSWMNSIATDKHLCMNWSNTYGNRINSLDCLTAAAMGWNDGDSDTVWTDAFDFSIEDNNTKLVVKKNGKSFATYTSCAR